MERKTTGNSTLAIGGVSSPLDSFVVQKNSVLRIKCSAKKPARTQSRKTLTTIKWLHQKPIFDRKNSNGTSNR
jgi:hypothetical protein